MESLIEETLALHHHLRYHNLRFFSVDFRNGKKICKTEYLFSLSDLSF
jgi:hypothetical protein